jgi:hypothetical protein
MWMHFKRMCWSYQWKCLTFPVDLRIPISKYFAEYTDAADSRTHRKRYVKTRTSKQQHLLLAIPFS